MYPSASDKLNARIAEDNARANERPEPLRSLLKARIADIWANVRSRDEDRLAYGEAINRFREKPDPLLIRQLVERLDDRSIEMSGVFETLMDEGMVAAARNIAPWKPENKKIAVEALIDSLPEAADSRGCGEKVIVLILAHTSLAALKMDDPEFSIDIRILPPRDSTSGGYGVSYRNGCLRLKKDAIRKTVLTRIAGELRRRWEAGGFCVERCSAPASGDEK